METATQTEEQMAKVLDMPKKKGEFSNIDVTRIIMGLQEIGNLDIEDFKTNYQIAKTITNLGQVEKAYNKSLQSLMKKYIKVGDDGNFQVENNAYVFKSKEDREEYVDAVDKLHNAIVEAKVWKLKESVLKGIKGLKGTTMAKCYELIEQDETND